MTTVQGSYGARLTDHGAFRARGLPLALILLCVGIVVAPLASGLRGVSPGLGRSLMALLDLGLFASFLVFAFARPKIYPAVVVSVIVYSFLQVMLMPGHPGIEIALLGLRKSLLMVMAYSLGTYIPIQHRRLVHFSIIFALVYVCLYALKQHFFLSSFDMRLLKEQSANIYTNMISGRIRAFSLLSSGFHVGMAANVLAAYALYMSGIKGLWRALFLVVAALGCYASLTRTFMFLLLGQLAVAAWLRWRAQRLFVVLGVLASLLMTELLGLTSIAGSLAEVFGDRRLLGRQRSYDDLARFLTDSPLGAVFGFGPGSAGSGMRASFAATGSPFIEPHNIFTKYPFELGVPLGVVFIGFTCFAIVKSVRYAGTDRALLGAIALIFAISGLLITSVETWPISLYAGLAMGLYGNFQLMPARRVTS